MTIKIVSIEGKSLVETDAQRTFDQWQKQIVHDIYKNAEVNLKLSEAQIALCDLFASQDRKLESLFTFVSAIAQANIQLQRRIEALEKPKRKWWRR